MLEGVENTALKMELQHELGGNGNFRSPLPKLYRSGAWKQHTCPIPLQEQNNIGLIVDLREPGETHASFTPGHRDIDSVTGINRVHIPLYRAKYAAPVTLKDALNNPPAPESPVPLATDIYSLYSHLLNDRGAMFAEAVNKISEHYRHQNTGILLHCTAGKDRTGLLTALLMLLAGKPQKDILADYTASEASLTEAYKATKTEQLAQAGITEDHQHWDMYQTVHFKAPAAAILHALDVIGDHDGAYWFLQKNGAGTEELDFLHRFWRQQA